MKLRKNKIQLINGESFFKSLTKNLGEKGYYISDDQISVLSEIYKNFEESEISKILPNISFGYTKVIVDRPMYEGQSKKDKKGHIKPDISKRDIERIPLEEDISEFLKEVLEHVPDAFMDNSKNKIGYEINFKKYFFKLSKIRNLDEIVLELKKIDEEFGKVV